MSGNRRRKYFIDHVFQKRLLVLFLSVNCLIVLANLLYLIFSLRVQVETNLYRSHLNISNITDVLFKDVLRFNLLLWGVSIIGIIVFYTLIRSRISNFFIKVQKQVFKRMKKTESQPQLPEFPEEFQEIDQVLKDFFLRVDQMQADERLAITDIKDFLKSRKNSKLNTD